MALPTTITLPSIWPPISRDPQLLCSNLFTSHALSRIASNEIQGLHGTTHHILDTDRSGDSSTLAQGVINVIRSETRKLAKFGQRLDLKEKLQDHADAIPKHEMRPLGTHISWGAELATVRHDDTPMYHLLVDSLYSHTPQHILLRWNDFRVRMHESGQTFALLVRQAELKPRKSWSSPVLELYFLLIDHNAAIARSAKTDRLEHESTNCRLSAYCTALRIGFNLRRMAHSKRVNATTFSNKDAESDDYSRRVDYVERYISREFNAVLDLHFQDVERQLIDDPIDVSSISKPILGRGDNFCAICQDTHAEVDCVSPLKCECVFGRDCLQTLLNRDAPSSYTCPSCRSLLHEPLKWRPVSITPNRTRRLGLLWALRSNMLNLKQMINADSKAESETLCQMLLGYVWRLIVGQ